LAWQLDIYQENLKQKTQQLRAMSVELDMYKQQVDEFRRDIEKIGKQLDR
jgi:Tfp pilus assembly protein PilO